jgi:hypothetical protein
MTAALVVVVALRLRLVLVVRRLRLVVLQARQVDTAALAVGLVELLVLRLGSGAVLVFCMRIVGYVV